MKKHRTERFLQWLGLALLGLVILFSVIWMHFRIQKIEVQIAEIHAMTEALVEWRGGYVGYERD